MSHGRQAGPAGSDGAAPRGRLVPGTVWAGQRQLIYVAPLYCYFTIDDRLYEWGTSIKVL